MVSYLASRHNTMLAMTTHGRSGLSQVVAGSVSHEVLHEAACPVAILRP
ncbi:universal stress protein [Halomonas citrativorans]|nr:universal stress protein [Halomonas citrativorans]